MSDRFWKYLMAPLLAIAMLLIIVLAILVIFQVLSNPL